MARQYTTPTITLKVKGHDITGADDVYVTFANRLRNIVLTIDAPTLTVDGDDTVVAVMLTQAQTAMFIQNEDVMVQVNWMDDGERMATKLGAIPWEENLLREVLT